MSPYVPGHDRAACGQRLEADEGEAFAVGREHHDGGAPHEGGDVGTKAEEFYRCDGGIDPLLQLAMPRSLTGDEESHRRRGGDPSGGSDQLLAALPRFGGGPAPPHRLATKATAAVASRPERSWMAKPWAVCTMAPTPASRAASRPTTP